ncbi:MAG: hypothetical protein EOM40_01980 [Clostridia bacterium]|nr:hypothetical protein [Clostridia bacterium]NCC43668.1 hypothetical protein [Clostridia bacterium]
MKKSNRWKIYTITAMLIALSAIGGVMAYFTDSDEKINEFVVGKIDIDLQEPEWDKKTDTDEDGVPDEAEHLRPAQTVTKDPQVQNIGINDAFMFLTVEVPCRDLITVQPNGMKNPKSITQLYTYDVDPAWKGIGSCILRDEAGKQNGIKYLYAYAGADNSCTVVAPKAKTSPLFKNIVFANVLEGQGLEEGAFDIEIHAYGIQTTDLNGGTTDAKNVWQIITNQKELGDVYQQ